MKSIHAVHENGVFRPTGTVDLPEGSEVTIETKPDPAPEGLSAHQRRIYDLLSQAEDTGDRSLSERHDGHQP